MSIHFSIKIKFIFDKIEFYNYNKVRHGKVAGTMVSYRKLWVALAEREMKKMDLLKKANFSRATLAKLSKNEYVALKVLVDICIAIDCKIEDIVEVIPPQKKKISEVADIE